MTPGNIIKEDINLSIFKNNPKKYRKIFSNSYLHKIQNRHFLLINVIPILATVLAFCLIPYRPPSKVDLICFFSFWALTEFCIVAGYHRFFTHRSFKAHPYLKFFLHAGGLMAGQGGLVSWVALHRRHHECSDKMGDPHSPNAILFDSKNNNRKSHYWTNRLRGILHAQLTWMKKHDYPNTIYYASELCRDKKINALDKYYIHFVILSLVLPGIIAAVITPTAESFLFGFLWGGLVRLFALSASIGAVNSFLHTFGSRRFNTPDNSRNSAFFSIFTFGDSYHNNHHAFPRSASAGLEWYRIDPAYWIIQLLKTVGLTWDVYVPSKERINHFILTTKTNSSNSNNIKTEKLR